MPRRVPFSAKKRRAQVLEKRAIKRGDIPDPDPERKNKKTKRNRGPPKDNDAALAAAKRARKLISAFSKPSPEFLEATKTAAATEILVRPIPEESRILVVDTNNGSDELECPRRPKWKYGMSKDAVEKNEAGYFEKWVTQTDEIINKWRQANATSFTNNPTATILPAPTYYERNIEVWRQLWRVCELSSILMILLDARCPPLHYPSSLAEYIKSLRPARQVILVLTKVDIVGDQCAEAWKKWLKEKHGESGVQIVGTQSYEEVSYGVGQGSRMKHLPHMPPNLLGELQAALKTAHEALLEPPKAVKEDPEKLKDWRPAVRTQVDWEAISQKDRQSSADVPHPHEEQLTDDERPQANDNNDEDAPSKEYLQDRFLTIGLIGQPNVGKSSLLNALFGEHKVKTSRTPGKTKHFQTLFLTPEIRLVDCPGLVLPALTPMELQVLSNVLPIAQIPALPACIRYVGNLMPIEDIFGVDMTSLEPEEVVEDKRTWRAGMKPQTQKPKEDTKKGWTAIQVMNAYATKRGWMTARTAWPDAMRGGNAMMRSIVEGKVDWAFWPPNSNPPATGLGIWSQGRAHEDEDDTASSNGEQDGTDSETEESDEDGSPLELSEQEEEAEQQPVAKATIGRFAALGISDEVEDEVEDETS